MMKLCCRCKQEKLLSEFYSDKRRPFGVYARCKSCQQEFYKLRYDKYGISANTIQRYGFKIALEVYERAHRQCETCGAVDDLTLHHLDGRGRGYWERGGKMNNNVANLQVLCRKCHGSIEGKKSWNTKWKNTTKTQRQEMTKNARIALARKYEMRQKSITI